MTTNPKKPAICWGLFRISGMPQFVERGDRLDRSTYARMRITSFSKMHNGITKMAHGSEYESGQSCHRRVDGMFFYETEELMNAAIEVASRHEPGLVKNCHDAIEHSANVQREYRVEMERLLGRRAIQPSELENL